MAVVEGGERRGKGHLISAKYTSSSTVTVYRK